MQNGRRRFLGGLLAAGVIPAPTWADAGAPAYLSAAARPDGSYALCGISAGLDIVFELPLPARGHAAAAHPKRPEAVAFARRPGTFAIVLDCMNGDVKATLASPAGRHFYGHGAYSSGGDWLFTTENDYDAGRGMIGVWDVAAGYKRTAEFHSGGIGPHDIKRLPDTDTLVIANGGIDTHPDTGRTKLNIPTMQPNLAYVDAGKVVEVALLPPELHKNSIRHLAVAPLGDVVMGMQWEGNGPVDALVGRHSRGAAITLFSASAGLVSALNGYVGSIAIARDARTVAITSPRGSLVQFYDVHKGMLLGTTEIADVCGVAPHARGFTVTSGTGELGQVSQGTQAMLAIAGHSWDNHLVAI